MSVFRVCGGLGLVAALGYVDVPWTVAGAGLCVFASIALILACRSSYPINYRSAEPSAEIRPPGRRQHLGSIG
jgi:hypothetical protein